MTHGNSRTVGVTGISRVEGEGSLRVRIHDGVVTDVSLDIFEPPRFFEALLVGRHFSEVPDITARICGICPVAYQMSSCAAIESALDVRVDESITRLRRLLYCGEWIQSHALHVYLLHAPDFLGLDDAVQLARVDRTALERGLALKQTGNRLMSTVGGRSIHPVNVRVGGFYSAPDRGAVADLAEPMRRALDAAMATAEWVSSFEYPDVEGDYLFAALRASDGYAIDTGRPTLSDGRTMSAQAFADEVVEEHVQRSTALHAALAGSQTYLTGPLARYAINADRLSPLAREAATRADLGATTHNPFESIKVRAVELVTACEEALRLIESYDGLARPSVEVRTRAGSGAGASEAPRGLLFHTYDVGDDGLIRSARIVPPTSQNQTVIEDDLRRVAQASLELSDEELAHRCERAVRNHDPCISCAAHFLDVEVTRT